MALTISVPPAGRIEVIETAGRLVLGRLSTRARRAGVRLPALTLRAQ
ncbi:MAG: hypothetical protein ACRDMX_14140 [Solirubrobacteraceae bacterium]